MILPVVPYPPKINNVFSSIFSLWYTEVKMIHPEEGIQNLILLGKINQALPDMYLFSLPAGCCPMYAGQELLRMPRGEGDVLDQSSTLLQPDHQAGMIQKIEGEKREQSEEEYRQEIDPAMDDPPGGQDEEDERQDQKEGARFRGGHLLFVDRIGLHKDANLLYIMRGTAAC